MKILESYQDGDYPLFDAIMSRDKKKLKTLLKKLGDDLVFIKTDILKGSLTRM
ncbi:MAG: hypothetical protein V3V41_04540 [Candidatus Heimdallarchaeota archaeon]